MKKVLFHRNYKGLTGGHLKLHDYLVHVASAPDFEASIFVTPDSTPGHPWAGRPELVRNYDPESADMIFAAGMDSIGRERASFLEL